MIYLYYAFAAIAGIVAGIVIAARAKKADGVVYGKLDKVGMVTNVLLIPVYIFFIAFCWFLSMLGMNPAGKGFLWVVGLIVAIIGTTGPAFCGLGLGASVALRKKGKSKQSFWAQFAGVAGLGMTFLFYFLFYGNLFATLN